MRHILLGEEQAIENWRALCFELAASGWAARLVNSVKPELVFESWLDCASFLSEGITGKLDADCCAFGGEAMTSIHSSCC